MLKRHLLLRTKFLIIMLFASIISLGCANKYYCTDEDIVQTSTMYTYDEMNIDIMQLVATYPSLISSYSIGTTQLGRSVPLVILGNQNSGHNILVQSSIHGREYIATQVSMNMIEYYAKNSSMFNDMLTTNCFYIVPMANPDGVSIAQYGASSVTNPLLKEFVTKTGNTVNWKANASGVDLNRNFFTGWDSLTPRVSGPTYMNFKGNCAVSENETKFLVALASARSYDAFISYHMQGNLVYYDEPGNTPENSAASLKLAQTIGSINGYTLQNLKVAMLSDSVQQGGFNDWVQLTFNKPGVTIELGSSLPPGGQSSANRIYEINKDTWNAVAALF